MLMDSWLFEAKFSMTLPLRAEFRKMSPIIDELATTSSSLLQATEVTEPKCERNTVGTSLLLLRMSQIFTRLSVPPAAIYLEFEENAQLLTDTGFCWSKDTSNTAWSGFSGDTSTILPSMLQLASALSSYSITVYLCGSRPRS